MEVEYEALELQAEEPVRLDFAISKKDSPGSVEFTDAWVRITEGTETLFAGGIHNPEFGKAGFTFPFPRRGNYELSVRFQNKDKALTEASFPLAVTASEEQPRPSSALPIYPVLIGGVIGLAAGCALSYLQKRKVSV
ncbi:MAG: hypothetical protein G01um101433_1062 [Parcubacteria group bacterium Gr01-1014_33]|nr:MAG: hypothetical protein G01um101433_1062 [Parcubacteria group bacterium Gr01-1014_33]